MLGLAADHLWQRAFATIAQYSHDGGGATSHHITSHHITSHHITSHHITSHHITTLQKDFKAYALTKGLSIATTGVCVLLLCTMPLMFAIGGFPWIFSADAREHGQAQALQRRYADVMVYAHISHVSRGLEHLLSRHYQITFVMLWRMSIKTFNVMLWRVGTIYCYTLQRRATARTLRPPRASSSSTRRLANIPSASSPKTRSAGCPCHMKACLCSTQTPPHLMSHTSRHITTFHWYIRPCVPALCGASSPALAL